MYKNNDPAEVIDAISKAQSVSEAVKAAGSYLPGHCKTLQPR